MHRVLSSDLPDRYPLRLAYITEDNIHRLWPGGPPDDEVASIRWSNERYMTHGSVPGGFLRPVVSDDGNQYLIQCETGARVECRRKPAAVTHYVNQPIQKRSDLDDFKTPDLDDPSRYEGVQKSIDLHHEAGCYVAVHVMGTFQGTNLMVRPFTELLIDFYEDPEFVGRLLGMYTDFLIADVCRRLEMGADGVYVCDNLGMNDRLLISPQQYREIIKPLHRKQVQRFKEYPNVKVCLHCDGNVSDIMDDLVEVGFDEINPMDSSDNMRIEEMKPAYGNQITLAGGFDRHVGQMEEEKLLEHIGNVIDIGKPKGRYIGQFPIYPEMKTSLLEKTIRMLEEHSAYQ